MKISAHIVHRSKHACVCHILSLVTLSNHWKVTNQSYEYRKCSFEMELHFGKINGKYR